MRTPLHDALILRPDIAGEDTDPGQRLAVLFEAAEAKENAYAAERLAELHQVAERAMVLGVEAATARMAARVPSAKVSWPVRLSSAGAGALLAACAPLVADTSLILAACSGIAAAAALVVPFGRGGVSLPAMPKILEDRTAPKLEAVASAADRALQAMVEPRQLPRPSSGAPVGDEDVLGLIQDSLMLGRDAETDMGRVLAENAERLAKRLGYTAAYEGDDALFETMVDPSVAAPVTLRPALIHKDEASRNVFGVRVRGKA